MTGFLIGSAVLLALALAFVLVPLWKSARWTAIAVSLALVMGTWWSTSPPARRCR
ncbi:hypothetical protein [Alkalisalibacterium limincola]|uniref:hypothetical protein n=1 Tax=Alkalisalibacterium limincola TaxID=2699169 RepID=UPI0016508AD0|nr:hypothetical protein [Alkalisalibacterium limincola]